MAVDGTKLKANASRYKAMSYGRMKTSEPALAAEVAAWPARADPADAAEDESGPGAFSGMRWQGRSYGPMTAVRLIGRNAI